MKFLLVNPWIEDFAAYDFWMKPYALLKIAAWLKDKGCEVNLIDVLHRENADDKKFSTGKFPSIEIKKPASISSIPRKFKRYGISEEEFINRLKRYGKPDFVLVTCCMTYWYTGAFRAIRIVKKLFPETKVLLGGNYSFLCYEHAKKLSGADFVIPDRNYESVGKKLCEITGLKEESSSLISVMPDFSFYMNLKSIPLITSYGCPYRCPYCASSKLYPAFFQRKSEDLLEELSYLIRNFPSITDATFYDDALLVNSEKHIIPILEGIIKSGVKLRFHLPNAVHPKFITKKLAFLMKKAGFKTIRLGLESSDVHFQTATGGKVSNKDFSEAVENLINAGFTASEIGAYILYGISGINSCDVKNSLIFVNKHGVKSYLATFSPIPMTEAFNNYSKIHPEITNEPLLHNDMIIRYKNYDEYNEIKGLSDSLNKSI